MPDLAACLEALASRACMCKMHANSGFGTVRWDPQSVERPKEFLVVWPADDALAEPIWRLAATVFLYFSAGHQTGILSAAFLYSVSSAAV